MEAHAPAELTRKQKLKLLVDERTGRPIPVLARHGEYYSRLIAARSELGLGVRAAEELGFHMTDWIDDLQALVRLIRSPSRYTDVEVRQIIMKFLVHAPAHVAAAHRIVLGDPLIDVFLLGAVKGSGVPKRKPGHAYPAKKRKSGSVTRSRKPRAIA